MRVRATPSLCATGRRTTRSFIEDARLLPELPALDEEADERLHENYLHDDDLHDNDLSDDDLNEEALDWQASTVISQSDDMSRTMLVDVPLDESGPLEAVGSCDNFFGEFGGAGVIAGV